MTTRNERYKYVYLENKHFFNGTVILSNNYYIITNPKTYKTEKIYLNLEKDEKLIYKLKENILFNPNNIKALNYIDKNIPFKNQFESNGGFYNDMAYGIGFFCAISLIGNNYTLDLNNCKLEQSFQHSIRQRFFALIELANSPFLPKTGPRNFINRIECSSNITIKNGFIGNSSHHGIHGNNNNNIILQNLKFKNFEVAAISLNGAKNLTIENIHILGNNQNILVLAIWSSALFLYPYIKYLKDNHKDFYLTINNKKYTSKKLFDEFYFIIENILIELNTYKYTKNNLFNNKLRILDGVSYGILLNKTNVSINGFSKTFDRTNNNHILKNIIIENISSFNHEIPALTNNINFIDQNNKYLGNIQNDVVGSVFQTQNFYYDNNNKKINLTIDNNGKYIGNIVSNIQLIIAKAIHNNIQFSNLPTNLNTINENTIKWVESNTELKNNHLYYIFQGDCMHHVNKGVIGLRCDGIYDSKFINITICNISNHTNHIRLLYNDLISLQEKDIPIEYLTHYKNYKKLKYPSHNKATYALNQGSFVRGISLSSSFNNIFDNIKIKFLSSKTNKIIDFDKHTLI